MLVGAIVLVVVLVASALASRSLTSSRASRRCATTCRRLLAPWQDRLDGLGLGQIDLAAQATSFLDNLDNYAVALAGPLQQLAVASLGAMGNLLIVLILSLYMVVDRDGILSFLFRLVPPHYKEEARLLETSVARSFGGFLRGQAILGVVYAAIAAVTSASSGCRTSRSPRPRPACLMAIPFFGPFVRGCRRSSWRSSSSPRRTLPAIDPHGRRLAAS